MRVVIVSVAVVVVGLFGAKSFAGSLPDLPGMKTADDAVKARSSSTPTPSPSASVSRSSAPSIATSVSPVSTPASTSVASRVQPILNLPGTGIIPVIGDMAKTSQRTKTVRADVLFLLAGVGTATALGMLWAVRRRFGV